MLTDLKPNHQADSLYTGKEVSEDSHLQIEPDTNRQLLKKNASEDSDFDYLTDFGGDQALISEAKAVSKSFRFFLSRTFKNLTTLGNELWEIYNKCVDSLGKTEGEEKFNRWLDAEFGNSQNLARTAISLSQWYNTLEPAMQQLVANNVENWSVAALKKLTSLTDELIAVLVKSGKQTEQSIERAIATSLASELTPLPAEEGDRPVTPSDWSSLREKFKLLPKHIKVLKHKAKNLASLSAETTPVVKVSHVNEAIAQCKEDPEILSQPPAKKAKKKKTGRSTPAESPSQDNSDEAITELISSAIASDMEKEQAANSRMIAKLQQTIAEKDATIAAQEEQITAAIAGEQEKAAHSRQMESLRQALETQSPPVEGRYTQEQLDEVIARDRSKRKGKVYTEEDVKKKIADAYKNMYTDEEVQEEIEFELRRERIQLKKEFDTKIAEARAEILESADRAYAAKLTALEQDLEEKDQALASLEKQKDTAAAEKLASLEKELAEKDDALASMSEQTAAAVAQARAEEREKTESQMASQITSLQQTVAELQRALAEKDQAKEWVSVNDHTVIDRNPFLLWSGTSHPFSWMGGSGPQIASLEEQNANSVASGSPLMEKEKEAAVAQARAEEREKMALVMALKLESLQKELAETNQALAAAVKEKAAAVAEARADEQAVAWHDIEMLQKEIKGLKTQNNYLQTTREQLATACKQVEELKSQLAETEKEYLMRTKVLEGDFNLVVESNHRKLETIKMLESGNLSMRHENRSLKDELAGYKKSEKMLMENYAKIQKAERLQKQNAILKENLDGQTRQSVHLASEVQKLSQALSEIKYLQKKLTKIGAPGFQGESYISPLNGQTSQGIQSLIRFIQDLISNDFKIAEA